MFAGEEKVVDEIFDKSKGDMILKKRATLGFAENDDKHCTILNGLIDFTVSTSSFMNQAVDTSSCCWNIWGSTGQKSKA